MKRLAIIAAVTILCGMAGVQAAPLSPAEQEIDTCVNAAAATDHVPVKMVDRDACKCATAELHKILKPGDFDLHERMLEVIASGADEKTFNRQMSDVIQTKSKPAALLLPRACYGPGPSLRRAGA